MLSEALEFLRTQFLASQEPDVLEVPGVETKSLVVHNGQIVEHVHEIPPRDHSCYDIDSFGQWCGEPGSSIWYSMKQAIVVLDDEAGQQFRRNRVTLPLTPSEEWRAAIGGIQGADQRKFLRWCLDHLDRQIEASAPGLLLTIRQVKFSNDGSSQGNIVNGKESFGKQINAEVAGASDFPDDIDLKVPVWAELDIHVHVRLAFIVDPHEGTFTLRPLSASKQLATRDALAQLGEALLAHQGDSQLFCGHPGHDRCGPDDVAKLCSDRPF